MNSVMRRSLTLRPIQIGKICEYSTGEFFFDSLSKVWLLLYRIIAKSQLLNEIA